MLIHVVILAGGLATRMRPLTEKIPKSMLIINGQPFIEHQLKLLKEKGLSNIVVCLGYLGGMLEEHIGDGSRYGLSIAYSYDGDTLLGTGGAIKKALDLLPENFFVLYGDSYLDIDYAAVEKAYFNCGKSGLMTIYKNNNFFDKSNVVFNDGILEKYSKKDISADMNYVDYGLGIINKTVFKMFENKKKFDLADFYEALSKQKQLEGFEVFNRFYEIGSKEGLTDLEHYLKEVAAIE